MTKSMHQNEDKYLQKKGNRLLMNYVQYNNMIMEYQKIANLLDNTTDQPSKFRTKNWVQINDKPRGTYSVNRQVNFKRSMLQFSLCDHSDTYILFKGNITVNNTEQLITAEGAAANNTNKKNNI